MESYARDRSLCVTFAACVSGAAAYAAKRTSDDDVRLYFRAMREALAPNGRERARARGEGDAEAKPARGRSAREGARETVDGKEDDATREG